jgi:hypothetical protein
MKSQFGDVDPTLRIDAPRPRTRVLRSSISGPIAPNGWDRGRRAPQRWLIVAGWGTTVAITLAAIGFFLI